MGKMALGEVVKGRNDKGARWHWANRQRVNRQKGEMVSGQGGKMVKGEMGRGRDGIGRNGKKSWAKWEWAKWDWANWEDTDLDHIMLSLSQTANFRLQKMKEFADDNFAFDQNGKKLSKQVETLWEKKKLLVMSNFSFSRNVFKRLV